MINDGAVMVNAVWARAFASPGLAYYRINEFHTRRCQLVNDVRCEA
jgi:hypothetical protein